LLLVPGLLAVLWTSHLYPPLDHERWALLAIALVMAAAILASYIQKLARQGRAFASLYWLLAVLLFGNAAIAAMLLINGALDLSAPKQQPAVVTRQWRSYGRVSTGYHLELASWRPGRSVEEFQVSRDMFMRVGAGDRVWVELHDGFLGLPWASGISRRRP
jgi:hypothetical protein